MLKNMKIATRLILAFGLLLVLLIINGVLAVTSIKYLDGELDTLTHVELPKVEWSNAILDNVNVIARAIRNMGLDQSQEVQNSEKKRIQEAREKIVQLLKKIEEKVYSEQGKRLF